MDLPWRLRGAAAGLTLLSGALMMAAGYVGASANWAAAGVITIPGGLVILAALALARRADRLDGQGVAPAGRRLEVATMTIVLVSGGVMVLAGYAAAAWSWLIALPVALLGGVVIGGAFVLDRRTA